MAEYGRAGRGPVRHLIAVICSVLLAASLFAAGFAVCTLQPTTRLLATATSNESLSPYEHEKLVTLAVATRDFTVEPYGENVTQATEELAGAVVRAAQESAVDEAPNRAVWQDVLNASGVAGAYMSSSKADLMYALARQGDTYALDEDAVRHLIDCNTLINQAIPILVTIAFFALVCAIALFVKDRSLLGRSLIAAPAILLAAMVALGLWAAVDWYGFFSAFHGVLFPQGNWTFSADSLLICMLPQGFWMGMGALWLVATVAGCIISLILGKRLLKRG